MLRFVVFVYLATVGISIRRDGTFSEIEVDTAGDDLKSTIHQTSKTSKLKEEAFKQTKDLSSNIDVTIKNNFEKELFLYYRKIHGSSLIVKIPSGDSVSIQTFRSHEFFATFGDASEQTQATFKASPDTTFYEFGPPQRSKSESTIPKQNMDKHFHPDVKYLDRGRSRSINARFRSMSSRSIDLWYVSELAPPQFSITLVMGQDTSSASYEGHSFMFTPHGDMDTVLGKVTVEKEKPLYLLYDDAYPPSVDLANYTASELAFLADYRNRTGIHWRAFFGKEGPRPPPSLYMWAADRVAQTHTVVSKHGKWHCKGSAADCQSDETVRLNLQVISTAPRVFVIKDFLSPFECDVIVQMGQPDLRRSTVGDSKGASVHPTRSSTNTWIGRHRSVETETITLRAADLLNLDEKLLEHSANAEEMQVLHYAVGQKYDPHHDWGTRGYPESRFITLLFYLSDMPHDQAGGETAFPKGGDGRGIKVHPGKGSAVLFYNLLPDGNTDDLALHEAMSVLDGEKWLSNYWVWDPKKHH